jgi:hypothetical protein
MKDSSMRYYKNEEDSNNKGWLSSDFLTFVKEIVNNRWNGIV